eukprot:13890720-Alexandrium_andersonii.AAC.1
MERTWPTTATFGATSWVANGDEDDDILMEFAPKRSRSGDRRVRPRAPKPPPSGPAAEAKPGAASASAASKNSRAEPPD